MPDLSFKGFNELCEANLDKKYVAECLNIIQNGECIYQLGFSMPHDHMARIYETRLKIAKDRMVKNYEYLEDFENCVNNINKSESNEIGIASLNIDKMEYLVFYEPINQVILGVLKVEVPWTLDNLNHNFTENINKGLSSTARQYSKGKFIRDWK